MTTRRAFIAGLGSAAVAWPLTVRAQQPAGKIHRVGLIFGTATVSDMDGADPTDHPTRAFVHALRALGYIEGQNLMLRRRSAEGRFDRFSEIVAELVHDQVDVIVTGGGNMIVQEAKRVTSVVPIVMANSTNPVEAGIVASLARPGGNITGFTATAGPEIEAKRLQMLKEALPEATRIIFLGPKSEWEGPQGLSVRAAARQLGVTLVDAEYTSTHFADAFALIARERPHALFVSRYPVSYSNQQRIADFAVDQRMPGIYPNREFAKAGGLMSYGVSHPDLFRRAAGHVDKILQGAKPADIPVEQPTKFELVINRRAAKALGLTIPPALLIQADEVID